jgi:hypothetical protein
LVIRLRGKGDPAVWHVRGVLGAASTCRASGVSSCISMSPSWNKMSASGSSRRDAAMISPGGLSHTPPGGGVGGFQCISANELQQGSVVRNENTSGTRHCMCRDLMDTSCILRNKTEISWIIALRQIPGAANIALPHCTCVLKSPCPLPSHVDGMTRVLCTRPRRFVETSYLVKYCARVKMFTDCPQRKNTPKAAWSQSSMQP